MADSRLEDHSDTADAANTPPPETTPAPESASIHEDATHEAAAQAATQDIPQQMVYRRAPKVAPFLVAGGVLGVVVACFWVALQGAIQEYSQTQTLGFVAALCATVGVALAALVWLLVDRRSKRQTETVYARPTDDPAAANVALTKDDYSQWSQFQQKQRAEEARRTRIAEAKATAKAEKRNKRK